MMKKLLVLSLLAFFAINAATVQAQSNRRDRWSHKQEQQAASSSTTSAPKMLPTPIQHVVSGYYPAYKMVRWYYEGSGSDIVYYVVLNSSKTGRYAKTLKFNSKYEELPNDGPRTQGEGDVLIIGPGENSGKTSTTPISTQPKTTPKGQ